MNIFTRISKYEVVIVSSIIIVVNLVVGFFISKPYVNTLKTANTETTAVISELGGKVVKNGSQKTYYYTAYTFTDSLGKEHVVHEKGECALIGILLYRNGQSVKLWYNIESGVWRTHYTDLSYGVTIFWLGLFFILGIIIFIKGLEGFKAET